MVRAEIDTTLFAQFANQANNTSKIEVIENTQQKNLVYDAQTTIELAKIRTQIKKLEKQLSVREDAKKQALLATLNQQLNTLQGG